MLLLSHAWSYSLCQGGTPWLIIVMFLFKVNRLRHKSFTKCCMKVDYLVNKKEKITRMFCKNIFKKLKCTKIQHSKFNLIQKMFLLNRNIVCIKRYCIINVCLIFVIITPIIIHGFPQVLRTWWRIGGWGVGGGGGVSKFDEGGTWVSTCAEGA